MAHQKHANAAFHHLFHIPADKEMAEVMAFQLFSNLGKNLVQLSLVFYMFSQLSYELWQICLFFVLGALGYALPLPFIGNFFNKIGVKHSMGFRAITDVLYFGATIYFLSTDYWQSMLFILPFFIVRGFGIGLSLVSYDIFLAYHLNKKNRGSSLAWLKISIMLAALLSPIVGGFITEFFGYNYTVFIGIISMIVAWGSLMLTPDEKLKLPYTAKKLLFDAFYDTPKSLYYSELGKTFFDAVLYIVWPLFLVLAVTSMSKIGLIVGMSSGVAMILAFWIGKKIDKNKGSTTKLLKNASIRSTIINLLRGIWWEPMALGLVDALSKINDQTLRVPYDVELYRWIHRKDAIERSHIRQMLILGGNLIFYSLFTLIFYSQSILHSGDISADSMSGLFIGIFAVSAVLLILTSRIGDLNKK